MKCLLETATIITTIIIISLLTPRSYGDVGNRTVAPGVETSPTRSLRSWELGLLVVLMMAVILGLGAVAISTIKIEMRGWLPWISCLTDSGNGREVVQGDVNGVLPLMTNGEPVKTNGVPLMMNGQHADDERGQEERQENGTNVV